MAIKVQQIPAAPPNPFTSILAKVLASVLVLAIVAVVISKNATASESLTGIFNALSSWIKAAMSPDPAASGDSSVSGTEPQQSNLLNFPTLQTLLAQSFQAPDASQVTPKKEA